MAYIVSTKPDGLIGLLLKTISTFFLGIASLQDWSSRYISSHIHSTNYYL